MVVGESTETGFGKSRRDSFVDLVWRPLDFSITFKLQNFFYDNLEKVRQNYRILSDQPVSLITVPFPRPLLLVPSLSPSNGRQIPSTWGKIITAAASDNNNNNCSFLSGGGIDFTIH